MNCKEKWGYTPKEILNMEFGLRDGKSMTHLEMRMDAFQEMQENENKIMYNSLLSIIDEINIERFKKIKSHPEIKKFYYKNCIYDIADIEKFVNYKKEEKEQEQKYKKALEEQNKTLP